MKLSDKIKYMLKAPYSALLAKKYSMPKVMSDGETLDYILGHECSVVRYGDGELNLMTGTGIKFQKADAALSLRLKEIAADEEREDILVCLPNVFTPEAVSMLYGEYKKWWKKHLRCMRGYWYKTFRGATYGDTNITRFYVEAADKDRAAYVDKLKSIWQDRDILIVEGAKSRLGLGNDLFAGAKSIARVLCPPTDAFSLYGEILAAAKEHAGDRLVICALGPTATVLCYDLAKAGIRALDLGHVDIEYEWFLRGAAQKEAVAGKSVTEVTDDADEAAPTDREYAAQIVCEVK